MTEENKRPQFNGRLAFIFAMMGSVIGLGNIWRFPYVLYSNGGASFLVAYLLILFVLGISHVFLEYGIGFNFKSAVSGIYSKINRKFEFIGWFVPFNIFLVLTYYICILSWALIYFGLSFFKAWGTNTNTFFSQTLLTANSSSFAGFSSISVPVIIGLVILWFFIWLISSKDINKGLSKASNILMPLMFIILIAIVIFAFTLPGASLGITNLFKPDWSALLNPGLWLIVLAQIAFSMGLGDSTAITFTSYIKEESHLMDNAIIVTISNFIFGIFASLGIFAILGFMSVNQGVPFANVVTDGTGLVFVAFPTIFNSMGSWAYIIGPLFFLCFLFAGFTSAIALFEPMTSSITEKFGFSRKKSATLMVFIGCAISFLYASGSGNYILGIADSFLNEITLSLVILSEGIIFAWIYGADKLVAVLNKHSKLNVGLKWKIIVKYLMPGIILFLWINGIINLINTNSFSDWIVELIFIVLLILIPAILTKLPPRVKGYYDN